MNRDFSEEPRSICHTQEASKTTGRGNLARSCAQNRRVKHEDDCSSIFLLDLILASICGGAARRKSSTHGKTRHLAGGMCWTASAQASGKLTQLDWSSDRKSRSRGTVGVASPLLL